MRTDPALSATDMSDEEAIGVVIRIVSNLNAALWIAELADLGVADALEGTPQSAADLAAKLGAYPDALRRVLKFVSMHGVFEEEPDGRFRHSAISRVMREDHPQSQRALLRVLATRLQKALRDAMGQTLRTGRPAVQAAAPEGVFGYLAAHPDEALIFDQSGTRNSKGDSVAVLKAYDFSRFGSIADIGGGQGHLLTAVLDAAPNARGVLFDLPYTVGAAANLASERLELRGGDFFKDPLPVCDAYLLKHVIHDWPDEPSIGILRAVRRAAPAHAKLLLLEAELPSGPESSPAKHLDVVMLTWTTGRERTAGEYDALLTAAGFKLQRVIPANAALSIFEATPV
jgi:hypothetical protein